MTTKSVRRIILTAHVVGYKPVTTTAKNDKEVQLRIVQSLEHFSKLGVQSDKVEIQRAYL
jgi:hypothetical protein